MSNTFIAILIALAPIHLDCGGNATGSIAAQGAQVSGASATSALAAKSTPSPGFKAEGFDPITHPQALLEAKKPVAVLVAWARDLLGHAAIPDGAAASQDTPNKLRARLAAAEQAGDPAAFAACLQLTSDRELPWAAAVLLTQARIRVADALVQETRKRFGADSDYARVAGASRSALRLLMQDVHAAGTPVPGFYLPNGARMFCIRATPSGWFVVPGGYDEVYEQPRKNTPSLLRDVGYSMLFLQRVKDKAEMPDMKVFHAQLVEASNKLMARAQKELDEEMLGGAYACPDCGIRSNKAGVCESCKMFR